MHPFFRRLILPLLLLPSLALAGTPTRVIAFAQDTLSNDFRKAQVEDARSAAARHPGVRFVHSDAEGSTALLINQIERFIAQKVDALIVGTNDENAVVPVIAKAHQAGIPVIILDRGVNTDAYSSFINSDNLLIGRIGADFIARRLGGNGLVLLFEGLQAADVTRLRSQGFHEEIAKHPGIQVIKRTGNYLRKDAILEMEKLVAEGIQVDAIFSESDSMLSGVRLVLERNGIDPAGIITVGCDYTSEAQQAIRKGTQTASVLFPLGGKESVETALRLIAGESVDKHQSIPVRLITRDDIDTVSPIF
jgi:ribose transport system substrate-binding protein